MPVAVCGEAELKHHAAMTHITAGQRDTTLQKAGETLWVPYEERKQSMPHRCECQLPDYPEDLPCQKCEGGPFLEDIVDTTMRMRRYKTRNSRLLSGRSAAAATTVGSLGALLTFALVPETEELRRNLMAVFPLTFFGGLAVFKLRGQHSAGAKLFWGYVAEKGDDGKVRLSLPEASCPWCGELMIVRRFFPKGGYLDVWVCTSGKREHRLPFDLSEFIELAE